MPGCTTWTRIGAAGPLTNLDLDVLVKPAEIAVVDGIARCMLLLSSENILILLITLHLVLLLSFSAQPSQWLCRSLVIKGCLGRAGLYGVGRVCTRRCVSNALCFHQVGAHRGHVQAERSWPGGLCARQTVGTRRTRSRRSGRPLQQSTRRQSYSMTCGAQCLGNFRFKVFDERVLRGPKTRQCFPEDCRGHCGQVLPSTEDF